MAAFTRPRPGTPAWTIARTLPIFELRLDGHLRRLDLHGIPRTDPLRTAAEGDEGIAIYFQDPDGNQFEFWAPDRMPKGAMDVCTAEGVGRVSSGVYGSRDLQRTAAETRRDRCRASRSRMLLASAGRR